MTAFVVPAFQYFGKNIPTQKEELQIMFKNSDASGFHMHTYKAGHNATGILEKHQVLLGDFTKWFEMDDTYEITYLKGFEPYIIARRDLIPNYDERFSGYGYNKISFIYEIFIMGFKFVVLPNVYVVAEKHPESPWSKTHDVSDKNNYKINLDRNQSWPLYLPNLDKKLMPNTQNKS
jgi:glycosyltransferase-like protein LARGE